MLGGLAALGLVLLGSRLPIRDHAQAFFAWVQHLGPWAPAFYAGAYALSTLLFLPGWIFSVGAGLLFGVPFGALVVLAGVALGGTSAFLLGRTAFRHRVERWIAGRPALQLLDEEIGQRGLFFAILLRFSPVLPFNGLNYALSITSLPLRSFALTLFATIPGVVFCVAMGKVTGLTLLATDRARTPVEWAVLGGGLLITVGVSLVIARLASRRIAATREAALAPRITAE